MSFFDRFCATLETAPVQAVFYGELAPHDAGGQAWTWLRGKRPGEAPATAGEQVLALQQGVLPGSAPVLDTLAEQHGLGGADALCGWFSGLADEEAGRGVLVLFRRGDDVAERLQSWVCTQTVLAIRNDLLLQSERHRYRDWLDEVRTIKEKLLPSAEHRLPGLDHAVYYQSSVGGGGDYYELIDLRSSPRANGESSSVVGVALCDVSGHGPGAAVEVAMIDAIVRTYRGRPQDGPAKVLAYINTHFFTRQLRGSFVTGVVCHVDFERHSLNWVNAGHLPIVLARRGGNIEVLDQSDGIPVGIERGATWQVHQTPLAPGDGVLLMSDGITEALSADGEQFGLQRVLDCLRQRPQGNAETVVAALVRALRMHTAGHEEQDDQTLLYLIYAP